MGERDIELAPYLRLAMPFEVRTYRNVSYAEVEDADGNTLAVVDLLPWLTDEQQKQVAHLFAAAPALLEALERLLVTRGACFNREPGGAPCDPLTDPDNQCAPCQARAALREARPKRREREGEARRGERDGE